MIRALPTFVAAFYELCSHVLAMYFPSDAVLHRNRCPQLHSDGPDRGTSESEADRGTNESEHDDVRLFRLYYQLRTKLIQTSKTNYKVICRRHS